MTGKESDQRNLDAIDALSVAEDFLRLMRMAARSHTLVDGEGAALERLCDLALDQIAASKGILYGPEEDAA